MKFFCILEYLSIWGSGVGLTVSSILSQLDVMWSVWRLRYTCNIIIFINLQKQFVAIFIVSLKAPFLILVGNKSLWLFSVINHIKLYRLSMFYCCHYLFWNWTRLLASFPTRFKMANAQARFNWYVMFATLHWWYIHIQYMVWLL